MCFNFLFCCRWPLYRIIDTFALLLANNTQIDPPFCAVNNDCAEVDKLILELADYKNDLSDMAAEKLFRKCSTS